MKKLVKVYSVIFMQYTNCSRDTISNNKKDTEYITVNEHGFENAPFLIKENDIDKYKDFGGGIKELIFAGYMEDDISANKNIDDNIIGKITLPNRPLDKGAIDREAIELIDDGKTLKYNGKEIPIVLCDNNIDNKCSEDNDERVKYMSNANVYN
jgi:hypothetical protein